MPYLNWNVFAGLPGGAETNFEKLCRALIRRHYAQYGDFRALASQPGVEFHLRLAQCCDLGDATRWYGWQCRWWKLPSGRAIGPTRKRKIREALSTSQRNLPMLTDWVLWTRHPLTAADQKWFLSLPFRPKLHLWTGDDVDDLLSGPAEILRSTYFGELVLNADALAELHKKSVAPILRRWNPSVHQEIDSERSLRRMLGESAAWANITSARERLETDTLRINDDLDSVTEPLVADTRAFCSVAQLFADELKELSVAIQKGDLDLLHQQLGRRMSFDWASLKKLVRRLRANRYRASLAATNVLADMWEGRNLVNQVADGLDTRVIAVVAEAGCGKTELAAELTASTLDRPAGILLHGRNLSAGQTLDALAQSIVINGNSAPSMEALVAALDAAGQRAHRCLPFAIDGLNESEDPRDWKNLLASLLVTASGYPYVLVVCTLRTAFADECLPREMKRIVVKDFDNDADNAIRKYFAYYKIVPTDAEFPFELLRHPLTLRLFCEVSNPERRQQVGVEAIPNSLTGLFDRYLEQVASRIAEISPRNHRYYDQDVRSALENIGRELWSKKERSIGLSELRSLLNDQNRPWGESIVRALEHDGVLIRVQDSNSSGGRCAPVYDALGGHLIADALVAQQGQNGFDRWIKRDANLKALIGAYGGRHPFAEDIFGALVGIVPRKLRRQQLWPLLPEPSKGKALLRAGNLEGIYIDAATVAELKGIVGKSPKGSRDLLDRLWRTRGSSGHPLNSTFLDEVLRSMSTADRDSRWTEWVRQHAGEVLHDLQRLENVWRRCAPRSTSDILRAKWVTWTLTSTVKRIRDQATKTLYWFGRGDSHALFRLTEESLSINDPYVPERMLAASYGVAMAHQQAEAAGFEIIYREYLSYLKQAFVGSSCTYPTNHWRFRLYVQESIRFAAACLPTSVPPKVLKAGRVDFADATPVKGIASSDPPANEIDDALNSYYDDDALAEFIGFRRSLDFYGSNAEHPIVAHLRGTIWSLGWRKAQLGVVDKSLPSDSTRWNQNPAERYLLKYARIGFSTFPKVLKILNKFGERSRPADLQIDPSFPEPAPRAPFVISDWSKSAPADDQRWIRGAKIEVGDDLFCAPEIQGHRGPWLAVDGFLDSRSDWPKRGVFGFLNALLVDKGDAKRLIAALEKAEYPGNRWLPEAPTDHYVFGGEIPWHPEFGDANHDYPPREPYTDAIKVEGQPSISTEILSHTFSWESYHSDLNQAGAALVPSQKLSQLFDLRGIPQSFSQSLPDGSLGAISLRAPEGFNGHLLYIREDLLRQYAGTRKLVWFLWGERNLHGYSYSRPDWLVKAHREHAVIWRRIVRAEDLSSAFRAKRSKKKL